MLTKYNELLDWNKVNLLLRMYKLSFEALIYIYIDDKTSSSIMKELVKDSFLF